MTTTIQSLLQELDKEVQTTRKMLSRIPEDKYQWRPHAKSMTIQNLATHIADLPGWTAIALNTTELDFAANPYQPEVITNNQQLLQHLENNIEKAKAALKNATDADLQPNWTLRNGEQVYSVSTKGEVIRMSYSQTVHHRAQLGVFLRLLDIPIPGSYGPSADEPRF